MRVSGVEDIVLRASSSVSDREMGTVCVFDEVDVAVKGMISSLSL